MKNDWAKRTRLYPNGSIEKRLEEITLTCLETVVMELNETLEAKDKNLKKIHIDNIAPDPTKSGTTMVRGLYPIVKIFAAHVMATTTTLGLSANDVGTITRINQVLRKRFTPTQEASAAMIANPQLIEIFDSPDALFGAVMGIITPVLGEYVTNRPDRPQGRIAGPQR